VLRETLTSSVIKAEVTYKQVEISVEVSKSIQKITELTSMNNVSHNDTQSLTLLKDMQAFITSRNHATIKINKVLFVNDSQFE
jgi:hypothetical protein